MLAEVLVLVVLMVVMEMFVASSCPARQRRMTNCIGSHRLHQPDPISLGNGIHDLNTIIFCSVLLHFL